MSIYLHECVCVSIYYYVYILNNQQIKIRFSCNTNKYKICIYSVNAVKMLINR